MQYNVKDGSVKLAYEAQPRPRAIAAFSEKIVVKVACGTNHTGSFYYNFTISLLGWEQMVTFFLFFFLHLSMQLLWIQVALFTRMCYILLLKLSTFWLATSF